MNFNPTVNHF